MTAEYCVGIRGDLVWFLAGDCGVQAPCCCSFLGWLAVKDEGGKRLLMRRVQVACLLQITSVCT